MKMDSDVLLLSYFDKICLILTGELWRALACLYSEARLFKGAREAPLSMQLHTGAEHFGNVIFRYSELTSQYHLDASIDVYHMWRARDKTIVSQSGTVAVRNGIDRSDLIHLFQFRHFYNFPSDKIASSLHMKMNNMFVWLYDK